MLVTALAAIAIVTQDQSALRAAPRDSAAQQAMFWQGDTLEIRGEKGDFLQVYDHRRERGGYVRASQVRVQPLTPEAAPDLLGTVRFLKDMPGTEALGMAYAAAYLRAAPAPAIHSDVFDALSAMSERLANRATAGRPGKAGEALSAHLEVAASHGVTMTSFERDGQIQLCPNGDAARRVLALPATDLQKAQAALSLTRHECVSPALTPTERFALDNWRAEVLDRVQTARLPPVWQNRLHLRKAGVWASLTYQRARRSEPGAPAVAEAAHRAIDALAAANPQELMESDAAARNDAAIRVGASRWGAVPAITPTATPPAPGKDGRPTIVLTAGEPGETCVNLVDATHDARQPLLRRCTWGIVWQASLAVSPQGDALALAVQPLDQWREMWVFRQTGSGNGWQVDAVPPGTEAGAPGYIEFAGWVPNTRLMLAAREVQTGGRHRTTFETLHLATLATEKQADQPSSLSAFYRWQNPLWKAGTVSLR